MIAAVLLAAGNARRFDGTQKLLAMVPAGETTVPLVRRSASAIVDAGLQNIVVVIGRDAEQVRDGLAGVDVRFITNRDYASGLSSSLRTGLAESARLWPNAEAFLIALGDQPLTGTGIIESILSEARTSGSRAIVAPRFRGELGNPVLFARLLVPELLAVTGDRGARGVVERDSSRVHFVDFDRAMPPDVDTVKDLDVLTGAWRTR